MRLSVLAAAAMLTVSIAVAAHLGDAPSMPVRAAAAPAPAACHDAVWPYVPAACSPWAGVRPVRLLRADAGR